jgi:hypothetical protein
MRAYFPLSSYSELLHFSGKSVIKRFSYISRLLSTSMDSNEEDHGPVENSRPLVAFFYISYIIVIAFFMVSRLCKAKASINNTIDTGSKSQK